MSEELFDGLDGLRKTLSDAQELLSKLRNITVQEHSNEFRQLKAHNERMREALMFYEKEAFDGYGQQINSMAKEALKGE